MSTVNTPDAAIAEAEVVDESTWPLRTLRCLSRGVHWLFGGVSLLVGLAVLASVPLVQFLSLGYLLEASGRVARSGRIRDGLVGFQPAGRVGSVVVGTWLMLLPLRLVSDYHDNACLIDPSSNATRGWRVGLIALTVLMMAHIASAWYCGGRLRHFFWPLLAPFSLGMWLMRTVFGHMAEPRGPLPAQRSFWSRLTSDIASVPPLVDWFVPAQLLQGLWRGEVYRHSRDALWDFTASLRLPHYFWLGVRGFLGAMVWLALPILLYIGATTLPAEIAPLSGLAGAAVFVIVLLYLPFLQTRFAQENRLAATFQVRAVRAAFRRAPLAFCSALVLTLLSALPLYLLMIEVTPREVLFLPALVFVIFIYPARLATGWAVGRAGQRSDPRHFVWRWSARMLGVTVALFYATIVFFTQYTSWYGKWSLFEQPPFTIPVPFLGG